MEKSKLYEQIFALQGELKAIQKDSVNPHFKNKYFDINTLIGVLKPLLQKHELICIQPLVDINGAPAIQTTVVNKDGDRISFAVPIQVDINPQKMGSIITYFRRYALQSLFLLEAEDDDGEQAVNHVDKVVSHERQEIPQYIKARL